MIYSPLPKNVDGTVLPLLVGKAPRAFADGYVAILLAAYLLALGFGAWEIGVLAEWTSDALSPPLRPAISIQ
jgi:hypothetical protein